MRFLLKTCILSLLTAILQLLPVAVCTVSAAEPRKTRGGEHGGALLRLLLAHLPFPLGPSLPAAAPSPLNIGGVGAGLQEHGRASSLPQPCQQGCSLPFREHTD